MILDKLVWAIFAQTNFVTIIAIFSVLMSVLTDISGFFVNLFSKCIDKNSVLCYYS